MRNTKSRRAPSGVPRDPGVRLIYSICSILFFLSFSVLPRFSHPAAASGSEDGQIIRAERRLGPFEVGERTFTVVLRLQKIEGAPDGFEETVESFSIVDDRGEEHISKAFKVDAGEGMFEETVGIWAFALESAGRKIFRPEGGGLKVQVLNEGKTVGLLLYYGYLPSAPSSGLSCQVFTLEDGRMTPRFPPLTVYGNIHDLQKGRRTEARRLFEEDTMKFGVWTGWFEVTVPVKILDELRAVPLHRQLTFGLDAFSVVVERVPQEEETFVRLYRSPEDPAPGHIVVNKESKVEFLWAYTNISFESGGEETVITVGEMPWLKVRVDGKEGFVKDEEDLMALGLRPAG